MRRFFVCVSIVSYVNVLCLGVNCFIRDDSLFCVFICDGSFFLCQLFHM